MKRLLTLALAAFYFLAPDAWAQTVAPSVETFMGPSTGMLWLGPNTVGVGTINAQTGTSYTIAAADWQKLITFSNGGAIAVTLPGATTAGFEAGKCFNVVTIGAGSVTVTPTTSTINGQATKVYATNAGGKICSDGTNYYAY